MPVSMSGWTSDELARMADVDELRIAGRRADGTLRKTVIIWMVTVDDDLYVRSGSGEGSGWFRGTQLTGTGHISAGSVEKEVTFVRVSGVDDAVDDAYRTKYARWPSSVDSVTAATARAATLRVDPA